MRGVQDFLKQNLPAMVDYILTVSTPVPDPLSPYSGHPAHNFQRHDVVSSLHERGTTMSVLEREAIPLLPHLIDIPRHLSCIISSVIRSARSADPKGKPSQEEEDQHLSDLCAQCFALEEKSLARVSQLASVKSFHIAPTSEAPRMSSVILSASAAPPSPVSLSKFNGEPQEMSRPYTAPPSSDLFETTHGGPSSENSSPSSPAPYDLLSLRRGSVPDIYPNPKVPLASEDRTPRPRFLRPKSISADSMSTLVSQRADLQDETGRKRKNILHGILTRR